MATEERVGEGLGVLHLSNGDVCLYDEDCPEERWLQSSHAVELKGGNTPL